MNFDSVKQANVKDEYKEIYRFIWNNIIYITTQEILNLAQTLTITSEDDQKYDACLVGRNSGSEKWLANQLYPSIPTITDLTENLKHVLLIDDACYSGTNICSLLDQPNRSTKTFFHIKICVATEEGIKVIRNFLDDCKVSYSVECGRLVPTISEIVKQSGYDMNWKKYNEIVEPGTTNYYDGPIYDCSTVALEYKIANCFGTVEAFILPFLQSIPKKSY